MCEILFRRGSIRGPATSKSKLLRLCMQERMSRSLGCVQAPFHCLKSYPFRHSDANQISFEQVISRVSTPPFKKDLESGFSVDIAMITNDSIVRLVECEASSITLTVSCCKLDIRVGYLFFCPFISYFFSVT